MAIAEWERAWLAEWGEQGALEVFGEGFPEEVTAYTAEEAAHNAVCQTVATTAAGLAAQLRFAYRVFGEAWSIHAPGYRPHEPYSDPEAYRFGEWTNGRDATLLASLLGAAQEIAKREALA